MGARTSPTKLAAVRFRACACSGIAPALRGGASFLLTLAVLLASSANVGAQTPGVVAPPPAETPPPGYREAIEQALSEYEAHNYAEARAAFLRAHALYPNARTLRGLGMMEFELRNYVESVSLLEQALASQAKPLDATLRAQTQAMLARAKEYVSSYALQLNPLPADVRVLIDGVPIAYTPGRALTLTVGEHSLQVQADGYRDERRSLSVKSGEQQALAIELRALQSAPSAALAAGKPANAGSGGSLLGPALTIGGGVVAIAGFAIGAIALGQAKKAETQDDADGARTLALIADISIGTGLASAAVGSYFWFFTGDEPAPSGRAQLDSLRLRVSARGASMQAGLRF